MRSTICDVRVVVNPGVFSDPRPYAGSSPLKQKEVWNARHNYKILLQQYTAVPEVLCNGCVSPRTYETLIYCFETLIHYEVLRTLTYSALYVRVEEQKINEVLRATTDSQSTIQQQLSVYLSAVYSYYICLPEFSCNPKESLTSPLSSEMDAVFRPPSAVRVRVQR